ncbi:uncharacterized protein LOC143145939 isoform X3 [Ptiloglossa arizonensis]|uniref:uncharacterized protein LOC143145939 isoform X3 n=1 Tax=Ptiloglossa arizonensis TaxID=3350558 RepID=UPI003F9F8499
MRVENAAASSSLATASAKEEANTMETVRDFVERIVEGLIGNVDDTSIERLYDHPAYESNSDTPTMAHTALREIVERAVEEARKLPGLGDSGETERTREGRNITEQSYEDLLATAILNKVIEKFQKEQVDGNSNVLHGKPVSATKCESETGLDEGVEEGCSSLEPLSQDECSSECSASCLKHVRNQPEPLSLTIEERIEEVTTTYGSDEDPRDNDVLAIRSTHRVPFPELGMDIIDPSQESSEDSQEEPDTPTTHIGLVSPIESWEENWLFQKKRVQSQADPVAMLVPNPSAGFKALIGDKDAEDTSDLSECSSAQSDEEIEKELMEAIINVVPRSPEVTGQENGLDKCLDTSSDVPTKEKCPMMLSNGVHAAGRETDHLERNESRVLADTSTVKPVNNVTERSVAQKEDFESEEEVAVDVEKSKTGEKEIENSEKAGGEREQAVLESTSGINDDPKKMAASVTGPKQTENNNRDSTNENNSSGSNELVRPTKDSLPCSDVPKTPTSTPRRTSMTEVSNENEPTTFTFGEEQVLNSLERAKKKLMAVDDDTLEAFKEIMLETNDFHAEDIQQESEYTEHYDIAIQRHLDSLTKTETSVAENGTIDDESETLENPPETKGSKCREAVAVAKAESAPQTSLLNKKSEEEVRLATPPRPGTIAEREHKKWENAPPIENNPYSEENIQKRLWERQYTRRSSDIPGIHTELPKSNGADMEVVLTPQEPDIKRFGRDYYINESKTSSLEKGRRSAASTSSRPSSSLSQRSSSTGADQEQQVSFQLEKFEAASLRGSLSRWTSRDSYSSPHFAINPLLHMDLDDTKPETEPIETNHASNDQLRSTEGSMNAKHVEYSGNHPRKIAKSEERRDETARRTREALNVEGRALNVEDEALNVEDEIFNTDDDASKTGSFSTTTTNISFALDEHTGKIAYNPLYEPERPNPDRDSGTYSIDTHDLESSKRQEQESYARLWTNDWDTEGRKNQILSFNGRKYWSFNGDKYHTFGGIKSLGPRFVYDSDEEAKPEESVSFDPENFANLKFQTFGGIKSGKRIDGKGLPTYRKVKLRSSMRTHRNLRNARTGQNDSVSQIEATRRQYRETKDTVHENFDLRSSQPIEDRSEDESLQDREVRKRFDRRRRYDESFHDQARMDTSSYRSSSDDDWQDEEVHVPDKRILTKFLKDATNRVKSRQNSDDLVYYLNTSRKKPYNNGPRKLKTQCKHPVSDDDDSLKLEPPIVPEMVERTFETLKDLRVAGKKKKREATVSNKKLGVRSLSDVTIW